MTTKYIFIIISCVLVTFSARAQAAVPPYAFFKGEGVFLSASDFTACKISYANDQFNKRYKIKLHELINTSTIKIVIGDSAISLKKDSIFGYRTKKNVWYRFYNNVTYKIINPGENILLY